MTPDATRVGIQNPNHRHRDSVRAWFRMMSNTELANHVEWAADAFVYVDEAEDDATVAELACIEAAERLRRLP